MNISWHSHRQLKISLGAKTAYVLATTTDSYLPNDNSIGSQIPYTPRYNGIGNISISWKGIFLNYNHQYTGYRFITTDESQFLKPYQVGSLQFSYTFPKNQYSFSIMGQVRNLWDAHFEVVNGRPMPGRSFLVSLRVGLDSRK
jgi:iron complex outermembrane receptor protein